MENFNLLPKPQQTNRKLLQTTPTKYVELLLINDYARFTLIGAGTENTSAAIANLADSYYDQSFFTPPVRVVLTGQVTFETGDPYSTPVQTNGGASVNDLLSNKFLPWAENVMRYYPDLASHDSHILISGYKFEGTVIGYAPVGGMCYNSESGAIVQAMGNTNNNPTIGSTVAHEMGHTLSMLHDDQSGCSGYYIMSSASRIGDPATRFSVCSKNFYSNWIATSNMHCLDNEPTYQWGPGICGNGIIEGSEQCDCGANMYNPSDCCQCSVCRLKSGPTIKCSDQQPCCLNCNPISANPQTLCRPAAHPVCDKPEYCSGTSGACPADVFAPPGGACTDSYTAQGTCYNGLCRTWTGACKANSTDNAACPTQTYDPNQQICQNQYCTLNISSDPLECFSLVSKNGETFAEDGVPCASGKQCLAGACLDSALLGSGVGDGPGGNSLLDKFPWDYQDVLLYGGIAFGGLTFLYCVSRQCRRRQQRRYGIENERNAVLLSGPEYVIDSSEPSQSRSQGQSRSQSRSQASGWIAYQTTTGRPYWFNSLTGETSWVRPT